VLTAPIPAGTWHLVGDGEQMTQSVTVRFDIIWRRATGGDVVVATTTHAFEPHPPGPNQFDAILFETDLPGIAGPATPGDSLVLVFTTLTGDAGAFYIPNGDSALVNGRIVNLTLP
jgi:hypothetical protein